MAGPRIAYITGSDGLMLKTVNAGESWGILPIDFALGFGNVIFTDADHGTVAGPLGAIIHTVNGGADWDNVTFSTLNNLYDCSFPEIQSGYACGSKGTIIRTTDGGSSWSTISSGTMQTLSTIFMVNPVIGYAAGENGTILKTEDAGITWDQLPSPETILWQNFFFQDPSNGFLVGISPVIYHTEDGGHSWDPYNTGTNAALNGIDFYGSIGYACGSSATVLKTTDGGETWQQIMIPELLEANLNKIHCVNENVCYITGNQCIDNSNIQFFTGTHDGGTNWIVKTFAFYPEKIFSALFFTDEFTGYVGGSGFIWKTADGGDHWIDQSVDKQQVGPTDILFVDSETGFSVSYNGQILRTTNGGGIGFKEPVLAQSSDLGQNMPNPFHSVTSIAYHVQNAGRVELTLLDVTGRKIVELVNQLHLPGDYSVGFDGSGLSPGLYLCRIIANGKTEIRKMVKN
jgi:photosystem II stability/assembly factor-like uncharacterized protein